MSSMTVEALPPDHRFRPGRTAESLCRTCGRPKGNRKHTAADRFVRGTVYSSLTPREVVDILELYRSPGPRNAPADRVRLRIEYGDLETGQAWGDHEIGYISRSTGPKPIPLSIHNTRSISGGGILDHCIVRISLARGGTVLWQHPTYREAARDHD